MKTKNKFNMQCIIEKSTLFASKIIIESDDFIPFRYNNQSVISDDDDDEYRMKRSAKQINVD
jgi:hypothetical protein